jgi:hypothetical protein
VVSKKTYYKSGRRKSCNNKAANRLKISDTKTYAACLWRDHFYQNTVKKEF